MQRLYIVSFLLFAATNVHGADPAATFTDKVHPLLQAHCVSCHGGDKPKAKLNLDGPRDLERLKADGLLWSRVLDRIEDGSMPPSGKPKLTAENKATIAAWVRDDLAETLAEAQRREGRSKVRRLSRTEYANTIHDLFGFRPPVIRDLPVDGRVDGFDKVSAALPLSSAHAEGYVKLAEGILSRMLQPPPKQEERTYRLWAGPSEQSKGHILELDDGTMVSFNTDTTSGPLRRGSPDGKVRNGSNGPRVPGVHKLKLSVYAYQTDKPLPFGIYVGRTGAYPQTIELVKVLEAPPGKPTVLETEVYLRTGRDSDLSSDDGMRLVPFGLGVPVPKNTLASNCKGPGLAVQWVDVEEPELPLAGDRWLTADMPPAVRDLFVRPNVTLKNMKLPRDEVTGVVRKTLARVGGRLFRRDLSDAETDAIMSGFNAKLDSGATLKVALLDELAAMMTAPDFLCVIERPGPLDGFALASRLSYFLWNSTPDEELLAVARSGTLTDPAVLHAQTERLLKDPRSKRFANDFVDQWLGLWGVDNTTPDRDLYPDYDELLKVTSVMETQATFRLMLDENRSVRDFVAPDWALVNSVLARHYGFPDVSGLELQKVKVPADSPFGGIWTQSATMKVTANGTLTSPVKRGVWVAERLLGVAVPPPPADIEPIDPDTRGAKTLREQLALHRGAGACAACHAKFDPYGFALESFDVVGSFRTSYRIADPDFAKLPPNQRKGKISWKDGLPVDSTGTTPEGKDFKDVRELRKMLAERPEQLARGVARHLLTYGTGAPAGPLDRRALDQIVARAAKDGYGLRSVVHAVVQSDTFRSK